MKNTLIMALLAIITLPAVAEEVITFTAEDLNGTNNKYELKEGTAHGITFKSYSYLNTGKFQFNGEKGTNIMFNTTPIPGLIKSLKATKALGTDRDVMAYISKLPIDKSNFSQAVPLGSKTVTSDGTIWNLTGEQIEEGYSYFYFHYTVNGALYVSSFEVSYLEDSSKKHVTYNSNGATNGTVPVDATEYESGDEVTVLGNIGNLEKTGFTFSCWNTAADGSGTDYSEGDTFNFTEHATLYAKWVINNYNVSWKVNGETWSIPTTVEHGQKVGTLPALPTSADFDGEREFVGWTDVEVDDTDTRPQLLFFTANSSPEITQDVTFHAVFANSTVGETEEINTIQYDSWTIGGTTNTKKSGYHLFGNNSYVELDYPINLEDLTKVIIHGGTYGGGEYKGISIEDEDRNVWQTGFVSGNSETGVNTFEDGTTLNGIKKVRVYSTSGNGTSTGVRMSQVDFYVKSRVYSNYATHCTPSAAVTAIEVTTSPTKTQYVVGEEIDLQGGEITVSYDDGTSSVMSMTAHGVTVSGYDKDTPGEQTITVAYKGKTATFTVVVSGPPSCNITWSVNGVGQSTQQTQGSTISFPENPEAISDYIFMGWTENSFEGVLPDDTDITYIEPNTVVPESKSIVYYAVFAKQVGDVVWEKQTTTLPDEANEYMIVAAGGTPYVMKAATSSSRFANGTTATKDGNRITSIPSDLEVWTISKSGSYYVFYNASTNKYAGGTNSKNQGALLGDPNDNFAKWTISLDTNNNFVVINYGRSIASSDSGNKFLRNNNSNGWATYASSTGNAPEFYKKTVDFTNYCINVPGEKPTPIISFSPTQVTAFLDDIESFVPPTLNQEGYVCDIDSWESSEPNVATVDEDGNVEIIAEGVTTITAVINETDEHNGASATYRLIVEETALTDVTFNFEDPNEWLSWGVDLSHVDPDINTYLSEMTPMPNITKSGLTVTWIDVVSSTTTNQKVNIKKYQQTGLFTIRVPSGTKLLISGNEGVEIESVTYNYYEDSKPNNPPDDKTISPTDNVCTIEGESSHKPFIMNLIVHLRPKPIDVQISTAQYATLYYSWKNLRVPTGLECITYTYTEGDNKVVPAISYRAGDIIPAGEGVVLHANPEVTAKTTYQFDVIGHAPDLMPVENNVLQGTDFNKLVTADEGKYIYRLINGTKGVGFYMSTASDGYLEGQSYRNGAHKAYLQVTYNANGTAAGSAPAFISLIPEDVADNITDIDKPNDYPIYNIVGQKVNANYKGIIIVGGKKYSNK